LAEKKGITDYLKIIAHLSRLLKKENLRKILLEAQTAEEILKAFHEFEA
jgi:mannitol/fructose-specific phosphotransferase system IIA component (Ntr-type)